MFSQWSSNFYEQCTKMGKVQTLFFHYVKCATGTSCSETDYSALPFSFSFEMIRL